MNSLFDNILTICALHIMTYWKVIFLFYDIDRFRKRIKNGMIIVSIKVYNFNLMAMGLKSGSKRIVASTGKPV